MRTKGPRARALAVLGLFLAAALACHGQAAPQPGASTPASAEEAAYKAFYDEGNPDAKIELAEQFARKYPNSRYVESVEGSLTFLYFNKQDWPNFFTASDKTIALDPTNVPVLEIVGWVIPRHYNAVDPSAASQLDKAESYERRALEAIAEMKKPNEVTAEQFANAQAGLAWRAHSGLGMVYFRRDDFLASAKELQLAIQQEQPSVDDGDLYVFGLDLQKLNRNSEAANAFSQCVQIAGDMLDQCRQGYDAASHAPPGPPQPPLESAQPLPPAAPAAMSSAAPPSTPSDQAAQQSIPTIKAQTNLLPVLVVVRDAKGHAIANLKQGDFHLDQDGKPQQITNFAAMHSGGNTPVGVEGMSQVQEEEFFNQRNIALFFDDVHLDVADLDDTKFYAGRYVSSLSPSDHVAIVTSSGTGELDFTNDQSSLRAAIKSLTKIGNGCPPMAYWEAKAYLAQPHQFETVKTQFFSDTQACGGFKVAPSDTYFEDHPAPEVETVNGRVVGASDALIRAYALALLENADIQSSTVFDRLDGLIHRMSSLPGERIITLLSSGFAYPGQEPQLVDFTDLATRSNVVVNTIQADLTIHRLAEQVISSPLHSQDTGYAALLGSIAGPGEAEGKKVLAQLADSTGGTFFPYGGDYAKELSQTSAPPEAYYLLAYSPQNLASDGAYHKLSVTIPGQKYEIQARHGFYAPVAAEENPEEAAKAETNRNLYSVAVQDQLPVKFAGQVLQDASGTKQLTVRADVDLAHLALEPISSQNQEDLDIAAALFDANGNYLDRKEQLDQTKYDDEALEAASENGIFMKFDFDVKPGDYIVRMVARNLVDGKISSENLRVTVPKGAIPPPTPKQLATAEEDSAYEAFDREPVPTKKIKLGETFEQKYPKSRHLSVVESDLVPLYYDTNDLTKFYAMAGKAIARDPDNVPLLTLVGWVIPRQYDAKNPHETALLADSEKYEKHALELISSMKKTRAVTAEQLGNAQASESWQAHSGLGIAYFRRGNYTDSAKELQTAVAQESPEPDSFDLYVLGVDLQKLNRGAEAADAFAKCSEIPGEMQAQCKRDAQVASSAPR